MQLTQDVGTSCHSQYVDADHSVLGRCLAGVDGGAGVWFVPTESVREVILPKSLFNYNCVCFSYDGAIVAECTVC